MLLLLLFFRSFSLVPPLSLSLLLWTSKKKSLWEYFYENLHLRCLRVLKLHFSFSFSYIYTAFNVHSTWVVRTDFSLFQSTKGNTRVCCECFFALRAQLKEFVNIFQRETRFFICFWIDSWRICHNICCRSSDELQFRRLEGSQIPLLYIDNRHSSVNIKFSQDHDSAVVDPQFANESVHSQCLLLWSWLCREWEREIESKWASRNEEEKRSGEKWW